MIILACPMNYTVECVILNVKAFNIVCGVALPYFLFAQNKTQIFIFLKLEKQMQHEFAAPYDFNL